MSTVAAAGSRDSAEDTGTQTRPKHHRSRQMAMHSLPVVTATQTAPDTPVVAAVAQSVTPQPQSAIERLDNLIKVLL